METLLKWVAVFTCIVFYIKVPVFKQLINSIFTLVIKTLIIVLKVPLMFVEFIERKLYGQKQFQPKVEPVIQEKVAEPAPKVTRQKQSDELPDFDKMTLDEQLIWVSSHPSEVRVSKSVKD